MAGVTRIDQSLDLQNRYQHIRTMKHWVRQCHRELDSGQLLLTEAQARISRMSITWNQTLEAIPSSDKLTESQMPLVNRMTIDLKFLNDDLENLQIRVDLAIAKATQAKSLARSSGSAFSPAVRPSTPTLTNLSGSGTISSSGSHGRPTTPPPILLGAHPAGEGALRAYFSPIVTKVHKKAFAPERTVNPEYPPFRGREVLMQVRGDTRPVPVLVREEGEIFITRPLYIDFITSFERTPGVLYEPLQQNLIYFAPLPGRSRNSRLIPEGSFGTQITNPKSDRPIGVQRFLQVKDEAGKPYEFVDDAIQAFPADNPSDRNNGWKEGEKPEIQGQWKLVRGVSQVVEVPASAPTEYLTRLERTPLGAVVLTNGTVCNTIPDGQRGVGLIYGEFRDCALYMCRLNAKIRPVTTIAAGASTASQTIALDPTKDIYPVCDTGRLFSQIVYERLKKDGVTTVQPPHGAISGLDPVLLPNQAYQLSSLQSKTFSVPIGDESNYPGITQQPRFGEERDTAQKLKTFHPDIFLDWVEQREQMSEEFYDNLIRKGGQVIVFNNSIHAFMFRLRERAKVLKAGDLSHITIIPIVAADPTGQKEIGVLNMHLALSNTFARS